VGAQSAESSVAFVTGLGFGLGGRWGRRGTFGDKECMDTKKEHAEGQYSGAKHGV